MEAVLASLVTGLVALGAVALNNRYGRQHDRERWERENKERVYGATVSAFQRLREATSDLEVQGYPRVSEDGKVWMTERITETFAELTGAMSAMRLCAPEPVLTPTKYAGAGLIGACDIEGRPWTEWLDEAVAAMRTDLGYPPD